jgi:Protein of unknown function (DUF4446)
MENVLSIMESVQSYITLGLIIIVFVLLILTVLLLKSNSKLEKRYRKFMRGSSNKNLEELMFSYLDKIDEVKEGSDKVKDVLEEMEKKLNKCIQRYSIIRYRAFEDVGSDLSFSIALLDNNNDGVIITGIYGRNESTTYAKPIDKGLSRYELSDEEKHVLEDAVTKEI